MVHFLPFISGRLILVMAGVIANFTCASFQEVLFMMQRTRTTQIPALIGHRAHIAGWLHSWRQLGGIHFLVLQDGWGQIQAVAESEAEIYPLIAGNLAVESVIAIDGQVVAAAQAPGGAELHDLHIEVITPVTEPPPVPINKHKLTMNIGTLLDYAVITNRHPARRAILRLSSAAMSAFRATLTARGFTEVQTPKIVAAATESGANVFQIDYFGRQAYLAQSPQFYKQIMVGVFERVFETAPVFRAEPHGDSRHLSEYMSLDVEFGFIEDHFTVMTLLRDVIADILTSLSANYCSDLALLHAQVPSVPETIPHIHFHDAQELILQLHGVDVRGEPDLSPQDERWLGAWALQEFSSDFLFVTGYPMSKRPFYTHPDPLRPQYSNSFDLLFRGAELVTGGQRLHRYGDYIASLEKAGLPVEPFEYYLEAFKYGMPPHGGFAIGLERLLMLLIGVTNIRLTATFPRDMARLVP
jgi:nondiscriminating aspartyl-tRNA synthetase